MNYLTAKLAHGIVSCANLLAMVTVYAAISLILFGAFVGVIIALTKWSKTP